MNVVIPSIFTLVFSVKSRYNIGMVKRFKALFTISVVLLAMTAGWAATKTWTGAVDTDWNTPDNWSPSGSPGVSDDVEIPFTTNQPNINIDGLIISKTVNKLTLKENAVLTLTLRDTQFSFTCTYGIISENVSPGAEPGKILIKHVSGSDEKELAELIKPFTTAEAKIKLEETGITGNKTRTVTVTKISGVHSLKVSESPYSSDSLIFNLDSKMEINDTLTNEASLNSSELKLSKDITIRKTFTNNGTFNANGNTVTFGSNCRIIGTGTITFFHLVIPDYCVLSVEQDIEINGGLNNGGTFNAVGKTVTFTGAASNPSRITKSRTTNFGNLIVKSGSTLNIDSNINININGNLTNDGTFTNGIYNTVTFTGTGNSEISGSGTAAFYNLTIDSGKTCTFNQNIQVANILTNNGTLTPAAADRAVIFTGTDCRINGTQAASLGKLTINSGKKLTLEQDINISKALTNAGTFDANRKTVTLNPPSGETVTITGKSGAHADTSFNKLELTGAGGKMLKIVNNIKVSDLYISGTSDTLGQRLIVRGSGEIELTNTHTPNNGSPKKGYFLEVQSAIPIKAGAKFYITESAVPGSANWEIPSSIKIWNGNAGDQNWGTAANWTPNGLPLENSLVIIPQLTGSTPKYPKLTDDSAKAGVVEIKSGAFLDLADRVISSDSTWSVRPKLIVEGTLKLTGTAVQKTWFGAANDNEKINLKDTSIVEYYGTSTANVWEGPYKKLKISGSRNDLRAVSLTVDQYLITDHDGVTITTTNGQTYHGNVEAYEGASYYQLTLANTGTGTIKTSRGVTTGNLTVNGKWEAGDQNNSANVRVTGNLTVNGNWELGHNNKASAVHTSGNITVTGNWNSYRSSVTASGTGNITANTLNTEWRCWGDITAEGNIQVRKMTASGGTIKILGNLQSTSFNLADYGTLQFGDGLNTSSHTLNIGGPAQIKHLKIASTATLTLGSNIKINDHFENEGVFIAGSNIVTLEKATKIDQLNGPEPTDIITITGTSAAANTQFKDLDCTDSYIKTLTINKNISVTGSLKLQGQSVASPLTVAGGTSAGTGSPHIALTAANTAKGQFLNVETDIAITGGPPVTPYTYTAENSIPIGSDSDIQAGKPDNWIFTNYSGDISWAGTVDSDWHNRRNWNPPLAVPGKDTGVTIPRKPSPAPPSHDYPKLTKAGEAKSITIAEKASLDLAGFVIDDSSGRSPLTVHGMLQLKGTADQKNWFTASAAADKIKLENGSTVVYYDNSTADIWGGPYYRLQARNRDKLVTGSVSLTVNNTFTVSHTTPPATLEIDTGTASQTYKGYIIGNGNNLKFSTNLLTTMGGGSPNITAANITVTGNWNNSARITAKTIEVQGSSGLQSDIGDILVSGDFTASKFIQTRGNLTFNGTGTQTLSANSADSKINNLVINQNASVKLASNITIKGDFTNNGSFDATNTGSPPGYTVTLTNDSNHDITGSSAAAGTKFYNLVCVNAGGSQIQFKKNISVYGNLTLRGSGPTNVLNLSGTNDIENPPGTPNPAHSGTIYINANKNPSEPDNCKWLGVATNLPIASLDSNTYTCTASESAPTGNFEEILPLLMAGHPKNWIFTDVKNLAWTGETNTDWDNPGNWRPRPSAAPTGNQYVTIRKTTVNRPVLGSGTYYAKEVDVRGTAALDLADNVIYTSGTLTAKLTTAGTLKLKGSPAQKNWFTASDANKIRLDMGADTTTVVYYGDSSMPATAADIWGGQYPNLEINGGITNLSVTGDLTVKRNFTVKTETQLSAAGKITVSGNTFINAASGVSVTFKSPLETSYFVLYGGEVKLSAQTPNTPDISATKDIILLGSAYKTDDTTAAGIDSPSGVTGLFSYNNSKRPLPSGVSLISLNIPSPAPSGSFADLSGKTLKANRNFYANGINLTATGAWTLDIPDNDNATAAFAEAYFTAVKNCTVTGGTVAAAEGCSYKLPGDPAGTPDTNTGWDFTRPAIKHAYTIWDDVIRLEFSEPIENSNDEISTALTNIKLNNGATAFSGAYTNKECTTSTNGKGDLSTFYLKSSVRWNTDAMGTNAGNGQSTDMGRSASDPPANRSVIPDLDIPKALAAVYETLRDKNKNRITDYSGINRFTAVQDNCPPVLIGVYTGQEMHTPHNGSGTGSQPEYDAHNFIEFRYSEPVNIYENTTDGAAIAISDSAVNIRSTNTLGNIGPNGSGLKIAGFADIASGSLSAASRDGGIPHALYRKFPAAHGSAAAAQTHRVRISIAGFADGTKTVGAYTVHNWVGYIDNAVTPSGNAVPPGNDKFAENGLIRSAAVFDPDGTGPLPAKPVFSVKGEYVPIVNTALNVPLDTGNLHGSWDTSAPVFARYAKDEPGWISSSLNEIIGFAPSNIVEKLEFHFFDNAPSYTAGETFRWQSTDGVNEPAWFQGASSLAGTSYDKLGGSRFNPNGTAPTEGGIRASSLSGSIGAFGFRKKGSSGALIGFTGGDTDIRQKADSGLLFRPIPSGRNPVDTLYLQLDIQGAPALALPITQAFSVEYDQSVGFVTDLAGNRMRTQSAESIDLTRPRIVLSIAPVGIDKVYILFNTPINTDAAHLAGIPHNLAIDNSTNTFDTSKPAQVRTLTDSGTGLILHLSNRIVYNDIKKPIRIRVSSASSPPNKMFIERTTLNLAPVIGPAHALSDFAVNVVRPLYVHDDGPGGEEGFQSLANGLAMRLFDGSGGPGNTAFADKDLTIAAARENGDADKLQMYYDTDPLPESVSAAFNLATGLKSRVWLPERLDAISFAANPLAPEETLPLLPSGSSLVFSNSGQPLNFPPDKTVEFLFGLQEDDGSGGFQDVTIDHDADGTTATPTPEVPFYALRLKDPNDPASIDLWSFNTSALKPQAGGVSILNNVINVGSDEKCTVNVTVEKAGSLSVMVMTLDGDVVKVLHSGRAEKGSHLYRWNGTNKNGDSVARGMYFVRVIGPNIDETRKVMAVKE